MPKNQHLLLYLLGPRPMKLIVKQDTAKLKMQCQCNTSLSVATTIARALLNINDDKQDADDLTTNTKLEV